ncbi:MAG: extracellular solute-binding protein [Planctomycetota bacterium]
MMFHKTMTAIALAALAAGCGPGEGKVVVYSSEDRIFSEPVLKEFERRTGIRVVGVYDTEETKSAGLVNRLIAKKDNPDGDVFWSGDPARPIVLKSKGVLAPYISPSARDIPDRFKDKEGYWTGFSARTRVLLINTDLVKESDAPSSILDLTAPRWRGQVAIANPLFGTTSFHAAALFEALGEEKAKKWFHDLRANDCRIVASNGEVRRQVASGGVKIGLSDSDDASVAVLDKKPVRAIVPDQNDGQIGNLVMPNTVSLIQGCPHPENAKRLIDFLLTAEVEQMLAEAECAQSPLHPGVPIPPNVLSLDKVKPMAIDYHRTAMRLERIAGFLKTWTEGG